MRGKRDDSVLHLLISPRLQEAWMKTSLKLDDLFTTTYKVPIMKSCQCFMNSSLAGRLLEFESQESMFAASRWSKFIVLPSMGTKHAPNTKK